MKVMSDGNFSGTNEAFMVNCACAGTCNQKGFGSKGPLFKCICGDAILVSIHRRSNSASKFSCFFFFSFLHSSLTHPFSLFIIK